MTDDWIGIILPTKNGKYMIARATIVDENIETLSDCMISVSDADGIKEDLKYPIVLVRDIETLREKLIDDIETYNKTTYWKDWSLSEVIDIINKRFGGKEK